jgi:hypothetical protein
MKKLLRQSFNKFVDVNPDEVRALVLAFVFNFIGAGTRIMRAA